MRLTTLGWLIVPTFLLSLWVLGMVAILPDWAFTY